MPRPVGSKNRKSPIFAFKSADDRTYFIRTNLPADAEFSVYQQPSLFNANIPWFYLKLTLKAEPEPKA